MYQVVQRAGNVTIFTGTRQQCWQYLDDEGLSHAHFHVVAV